MPRRIIQLKLTNFRGATRPITVKFVPEKNGPKTNIVVIFGENGTGKSTLVDALDAIGNASFGSLIRPGIQTPQKHVASLTCDVKSVEVELTTQSGHRCRATFGGKNVTLTPENKEANMPEIRVLRRRDLLKLIEASAADRYKAIQDFIAVSGVDIAESALRADWNTIDKQVNEAKVAQTQAEKSLRALWQQEKQPEESQGDPLVWATRRMVDDVSGLQSQFKNLSQLQGAIQQLDSVVLQWKTSQETCSQAKKELDQTEADLFSLNQQTDERSTELIDLLNSAERYLAPPAEPTACPLCETGVKADQLRKRIQTQLEQLKTSRAMVDRLKQAQSGLKTATDECHRYNQALHQTALKMTAFFVANEPAAVKSLGIDWQIQQQVMLTSEANDTTSAQVATLAEQLLSIDPALQLERDTLQTRITVYSSIKSQLDLLTESTTKVSSLSALFDRLDKVYRLVIAKRRAFVQTILDEIIDEVNALYETIHPGEKIGLHRLEIDESKRASLEQQARFEDEQGIVPQAYFSESHLDTFGFCLWLALAKRGNPNQLILVLDDVFTSVDGQHFRRISELLELQAPSFQQIIIATHNRLWHDYYKSSGNNAHLIKLERWTITHGLRPYEDRTLATELATALAADQFDRQVVASKAGVLLENVLDSLAAYYECQLKYKPGRSYTLGELLRATKKLFQEARIHRVKCNQNGQPIQPQQPENWVEITLKDYHQKLDGILLIRNEVGAHFNPSGNDWSDNDVREFGQAAYDLAEALACPQCGHIPKNVRSDHRGCSCEATYQTRLYPMHLN